MSFQARTLRSSERFYRVEVNGGEQTSVVSEGSLRSTVVQSYAELFGSISAGQLEINVYPLGENEFIISSQSKFATGLKIALMHSSDKGIRAIRVVSSSSFIQPLVHNSRAFFPPL